MTQDSVRSIVGFEDDSSLRCAPAALISGRYRISSVTSLSRTPGPHCRIQVAGNLVPKTLFAALPSVPGSVRCAPSRSG